MTEQIWDSLLVVSAAVALLFFVNTLALFFLNTLALLVRATIVATALKVCASLFRMSFTSETCV